MSWGVMSGDLGWGIIDEGWRKGPWTGEEDRMLIEYVKLHGEGRWNSVARLTGLKRNGKSCRLRWVNYLRPDLKRGQITPQEESIIIELHGRWGNRWSTIARSLPGRTDNEIKNYWRTHFKKKTKASSNNSDKVKNRLLKKQKFHQQQQQQQQQPHEQQQNEQQQLLQLHQIDMKKLMSILDENDHKGQYIPHLRQDIPSTYTNTSDEQSFCYTMGNGDVPVQMAETVYDDMLWDGLWNLDDANGNYCSTNKASLQNLMTPFC